MSSRLWPRHTLSIPGQGLSDHHYRLHSVSPCVELQPFAILWGNQGNLALNFLEDRTVQIYSINIPHHPSLCFSIGGQDKKKKHQNWRLDWPANSREVISTTENRISIHFNFQFCFRMFWMAAAERGNFSKLLIWQKLNLHKKQFNTFAKILTLAELSEMMRSSAAAERSKA